MPKPREESVLIAPGVCNDGSIVMVRKNESGDNILYKCSAMNLAEISSFVAGKETKGE